MANIYVRPGIPILATQEKIRNNQMVKGLTKNTKSKDNNGTFTENLFHYNKPEIL